MDLLLDTHIFLWSLTEPHKIPPQCRAAIEDSTSRVFVSAVVAWEIAIKYRRGRLPLPRPASDYVPDRIAQAGYHELSITVPHALAVGTLPPLHNDPFDRILIAQSIVEGYTLVSVDKQIQRYAVRLLSS